MKDLVDFIKGFDLHTIVTIGVAFFWINGSIHDVEDRLDAIEKDMIAVKTALSIHKILPDAMANNTKQGE
jgi:hypothetical protein